MSSGYSRFDTLSGLLVGTATVAAIVISQSAALSVKTGEEVAQIAKPRTVQINNQLNPGGSGVIIAKKGKTYTVLTANHVVKWTDLKYTIRTYNGKEYPVTDVQRLQRSENEPDLAVVQFNSPEEYTIATIGDSNQVAMVRLFIFVAIPCQVMVLDLKGNKNLYREVSLVAVIVAPTDILYVTKLRRGVA